MKHVFSILIVILLFSCQDEQPIEMPLSFDVTNEIVNPKQYLVTKTSQKMIIDGKEDETSWQNAVYSDSFIDIEGVKTPKFDTKMKMLWDEKFLYVFTRMEEPHVWGNLKQRDTVIFFNNDFEVFISPSGTQKNYAEIEINSLGTVWDLLLDKPYRVYGKANNHWNLDSLKSAVHVVGTLNNPNDIDSLWNVELAIPMDALIELKNKPISLPKEGEQWRINFSRVEWDYDLVNGIYQRKKNENGEYQAEYNWVWSNQNVINMHEPEKWGYIQFTNDSTSSNKEFIEDEYALTKQICYALFRQTRFGELKELLKEKIGFTRTLQVRYSDKDSIEATFYKTNFGFEYQINDQTANKTFIINETGALEIK